MNASNQTRFSDEIAMVSTETKRGIDTAACSAATSPVPGATIFPAANAAESARSRFSPAASSGAC
ncbi:hypothetical protein [Lysobacter gummosus]|uniref:hypothetical protein n=1 Tax=Lysobacter gummosus TaxID=262324 RepID=UPI0036433C40